jgi:hypothetical protein
MVCIPMTCSCGNSPCKHMISAIRHTRELKIAEICEWDNTKNVLYHLFDKQFFVSEYVNAYSYMIPTTRPLLSSLVPSLTTRNPVFLKGNGNRKTPRRNMSLRENNYKRLYKKKMRIQSLKKVKVDTSIFPVKVTPELMKGIDSVDKAARRLRGK